MSNGIDIVYVNRFNDLKNNKLFMGKIFTKEELKYIEKTNYNISSIGGIYASKEAFLKAIKKGIDSYSLKDIEVLHNKDNAPYLKFYNDLDKYNNINISLSISHDNEYAIASVLIF